MQSIYAHTRAYFWIKHLSEIQINTKESKILIYNLDFWKKVDY